MEYTKKHKNPIANLFKKAGMLKEAKVILTCDKYKPEIAPAIRLCHNSKMRVIANPERVKQSRF